MGHNDGQFKHAAEPRLSSLDAEQIRRIEQALADVGDFGEVRLIKAKGKLRFIQKVSSEEIGGNRQHSVE